MPTEFTIQRRVQFAETDMAGVMHFANYFRIMEEVEHAFWRSAGASVHSHDDAGVISWPRVAVSCEYMAPARFEDELTLRLTVTAVGRKSVEYAIEFLLDSTVIAVGNVKAVCCRVEHKGFSAIAIPDAMRQMLESLKTR